jgi:excisionase family DNA binding protein
MKSRPTQFGVRENTVSTGQHDSRLSTGIASNALCLDDQPAQTQRTLFQRDRSTASPQDEVQAAPKRTATLEEMGPEDHFLTVHEVAKLLQVPVSWVYGRVRKRSIERIPGYRIGKYWRFRQEEVIAWVESRGRTSHVS